MRGMSCGKTRRMRAALGGVVAAALFIAADARAENGRLIVKSTPPGASVYLDEDAEPRGVTPLELAGVSPGLHKIRISLAKHDDQKRGFYLVANGERALDFTLQPSEGEAPGTNVPGLELVPGPEPKPGPEKKKPAFEKKEKVPKTIDVECPACKGSCLLETIGCSYCRGTGYAGGGQCEKCNGSSRVDYPCPYCKGKGKLVVGGKERECPKCRGKGHLPCPLCKGSGTIKRPNPAAASYPTKPCPRCDGTGFLKEAKCLFCGGGGKIRVIISTSGGTGWGDGIREEVSCPYCNGTGKGPPLCRRCQGRGYKGSREKARPCPHCFGTGLSFVPCPACRGRGYVRSRE